MVDRLSGGTPRRQHSRPNFGRSQRKFDRRGKIINCVQGVPMQELANLHLGTTMNPKLSLGTRMSYLSHNFSGLRPSDQFIAGFSELKRQGPMALPFGQQILIRPLTSLQFPSQPR